MVISDGQSESEADEDVIKNIAGIEDSSSASSEGEYDKEEAWETSSNEDFEEDFSTLFCGTRSGRLTHTWACSKYRYTLLLLPLHFDIHSHYFYWKYYSIGMQLRYCFELKFLFKSKAS